MAKEEPEVLKEWSVASPVLFLIPSLFFSQANKTPLRPLDPSRLQGINCGPDFTPSFANLGRPALSNRGPPRGGPGGELPRGPVSGTDKGCAGGVCPCISLKGGEVCPGDVSNGGRCADWFPVFCPRSLLSRLAWDPGDLSRAPERNHGRSLPQCQ